MNGALAGTRTNSALPVALCPRALSPALKLLRQSVQMVLLASTRGARLALGAACRERVLSPRRASDDVIFAIGHGDP